MHPLYPLVDIYLEIRVSHGSKDLLEALLVHLGGEKVLYFELQPLQIDILKCVRGKLLRHLTIRVVFQVHLLNVVLHKRSFKSEDILIGTLTSHIVIQCIVEYFKGAMNGLENNPLFGLTQTYNVINLLKLLSKIVDAWEQRKGSRITFVSVLLLFRVPLCLKFFDSIVYLLE